MTLARCSVPLLLFALLAIAVFVLVGGREFQEVLSTHHFWFDHADCQDIKDRAMTDQNWLWAQTPRGMCAFYQDAKSHAWIVIIVAISGSVLWLITGHRVKSPDAYLSRKSNKWQ